eukprot:748079-Hanusia_phi.AAC.1
MAGTEGEDGCVFRYEGHEDDQPLLWRDPLNDLVGALNEVGNEPLLSFLLPRTDFDPAPSLCQVCAPLTCLQLMVKRKKKLGPVLSQVMLESLSCAGVWVIVSRLPTWKTSPWTTRKTIVHDPSGHVVPARQVSVCRTCAAAASTYRELQDAIDQLRAASDPSHQTAGQDEALPVHGEPLV